MAILSIIGLILSGFGVRAVGDLSCQVVENMPEAAIFVAWVKTSRTIIHVKSLMCDFIYA
jgi:hypothetical protein